MESRNKWIIFIIIIYLQKVSDFITTSSDNNNIPDLILILTVASYLFHDFNWVKIQPKKKLGKSHWFEILLFLTLRETGFANADDNILNKYKLDPNTKYFDFSNSNITSLEQAMFNNYVRMRIFNLDDNPYFPLDSENQQPILNNNNIYKFTCNRCGFKKIYDHTLSGLPNLQKLELNHNAINYISSNAFYNNKLLLQLELKYNNLKDINPSSYSNDMSKIMFVALTGNKELTFKHFTYWNDLILECRSCGVHNISKETFRNVPNLKFLDLQNNKIIHIEKNAFENNNQLTYLDFSDNSNINSNHLFEIKSNSVETLICNNCSIKMVTSTAFIGIPNLKDLKLNQNRISSFNDESLQMNKKLNTLELDGNFLKSFPLSVVNHLQELEQLCLDDNEFVPSYNHTILMNEYIKRKLRHDCRTEKPFENNKLRILDPGVILYKGMDEVIDINHEVVNISGRNIVYIEPAFFNQIIYRRLSKLIMDKNHNFKFMEGSKFLNHNTLGEYSCNYCNISSLYPETFMDLKHLRIIELKYNRIEELLPEPFSYMEQLKELYLDGNNLKHFSSHIIDKLPKLTILSLSDNTEFTIRKQRIFLYSDKITNFICNNCNINGIYEDTFYKMPQLEILKLNNNKLNFIQNTSFLYNLKLKEVHLNGNEITDSMLLELCSLKNLEKLCVDSHPDVIDLKCAPTSKCASFKKGMGENEEYYKTEMLNSAYLRNANLFLIVLSFFLKFYNS